MKNLYYLAVFALLAVVTTSCKDDKTDEPEVAKITVESNALTCEAGESTLDFSFNSSLEWTIQYEQGGWLSVDPVEGAAGDVTMRVAVAANDTEASRSAVFSILSRSEKIDVTVTQAGLDGQVFDPLFKTYLVQNFDTDGDGEINRAEAAAITEIDAATGNSPRSKGSRTSPRSPSSTAATTTSPSWMSAA